MFIFMIYYYDTKGPKWKAESGPNFLLLGTEVSFHEGPKCIYQKKKPKCPIGAEVVGAEVVARVGLGLKFFSQMLRKHEKCLSHCLNFLSQTTL